MLKAVQIFLGQALNLGQQGTYDIIFYGSDGQKEQPAAADRGIVDVKKEFPVSSAMMSQINTTWATFEAPLANTAKATEEGKPSRQ